jgi:hypothetical protein
LRGPFVKQIHFAKGKPMKKSITVSYLVLIIAMLLVACSPTAATRVAETVSTPGVKASAIPVSNSSTDISVAAGETRVIDKTTQVNTLTIAKGGTLKAPDGYSLTMTIDGVETGQALVTTAGTDTQIAPGNYKGNIVLTVTEKNPVAKSSDLVFPFRQALYLNDTGVVAAKSVLAAIGGEKPSGSAIKDLKITSTGECFNGIFVAGGSYNFVQAKINLSGNCRSDFAGYGAAVMSTGTGTTTVLDGATIENKGVVRTAVIATGGSNMIVKNSHIQANNGVLPADYQPTTDTAQMRSVPWMLGLSGNVRATNLLGENTKATYINSYVGSEAWGVLSTDECTNPKLTAINTTVAVTGADGYGSYAIGNATEKFLGSTFNVATYANIIRGGSVYYGDSDSATVAKLNTELGLNLTSAELAALPEQHTTVNSKRFGVMWHGSGTVNVSGSTVFNTAETTFLDKGQVVTVTVDGSKGAQLKPQNGIIFQLMENDDPGSTTGTFTPPTTSPTKNKNWDVTSTANAATATFSNIVLEGNFYNAMRGDASASAGDTPANGGAPSGNTGGTPPTGSAGGTPPNGAPPGGAGRTPPNGTPPDGAGGTPPNGTPPNGASGTPSNGTSPTNTGSGSSVNMVLTFDKSTITGVISASEARYADGVTLISEANFHELGNITNKVSPTVNNGVIVTLTNGSKWIVAGTSYLSSLKISADSTVSAATGHKVTMTVDGVATNIVPGKTYTGAIVLTIL